MQALIQYDLLHPDETTQTFESIVSYLEDHLPNLRHSSQISSRATAQIMAPEAYITLEAENKKLKAAQGDRKRRDSKGKGKGKGKGGPKKLKKNRAKGDKDKSRDKPLLYCHAGCRYGTIYLCHAQRKRFDPPSWWKHQSPRTTTTMRVKGGDSTCDVICPRLNQCSI